MSQNIKSLNSQDKEIYYQEVKKLVGFINEQHQNSPPEKKDVEMEDVSRITIIERVAAKQRSKSMMMSQ